MNKIIENLKLIVGGSNVLTDNDIIGFCSDWTGQYTSNPIAVVRPANTDQVSSIVKLANSLQFSIVPVSGNTGLAGGTHADGSVMLSLDRLNDIYEVNPKTGIAVVGAGVILSDVYSAVDPHNMIFPMIIGSKGSAQIGGCLSTNAGGSNVLRYGNTRDLCLGLEVVLPNGEIMDLMSRLHKDNSGYNLKHLIIGAEGTLGIITAAVLKLFPKPEAYATAFVAVDSIDNGLKLLNILRKATSGAVEAFELMPRVFMQAYNDMFPQQKVPFDKTYDFNILVEIGATAPRDTKPQLDGSIPIQTYLSETLMNLMEKGNVVDAVIANNDTQRSELWAVRDAAADLALTHPFAIGNDIALSLDDVDTFITYMEHQLPKIDPTATIMLVVHLGDGNLHYTVHPSSNDPALRATIISLVEDMVKELNGSFSAEHGIGISKLPSMLRNKDKNSLNAMRLIKHALDPQGILNPGKVIPMM